jgi:Mor family transcriptional regulator
MPTRKTPNERLKMIIREIAISFARATGSPQPTREQIRTVELEISQHFGGERLYVPSHPKARRQASVAAMLKESGKTQRDMARAIGMSERGLRKALTGK